MKQLELYAGSWNPYQQMPHRELLNDYINDCREKLSKGEPQEWVLVSIGFYDDVGEDLTDFENSMMKKKRGSRGSSPRKGYGE